MTSLKLRINFEHHAKTLVAVISSTSLMATHKHSNFVNILLVLVFTTILNLLTINCIAFLIVSELLSTNFYENLTFCQLFGLCSKSLQASRSDAPRAPKTLNALKRVSTQFAPKSFAGRHILRQTAKTPASQRPALVFRNRTRC